MDFTNPLSLPVTIGIIIALVISLIFKLCSYKNAKEIEKVKSLGYTDIEGIDVFLSATPWDFGDFIKSQGVRKAFQRFHDTGDMSGIVKTEHDTTCVPIVMPINTGQR